MKNQNYLVIVGLLVLSLASGFCFGLGIGEQKVDKLEGETFALNAEVNRLESEIIWHELRYNWVYAWLEIANDILDKVELPVEKIFYVDKPYEVEKIVEVERIVEVEKVVSANITPQYFQDVEEAQAWLDANRLPIVLIAGSDGVVKFNEPEHNPRYDCDDYAQDLETLALESGHRIWQVPVINGRIWGIKVTDISESLHAGNMTKINNVYYYIESSPSPTRWQLVKILEAD